MYLRLAPSVVLNKLITRLRQSGAASAVAGAGRDPAQLALLFRYFPIGARLTYFFEQRRELQFSTQILGYRINGHDLYEQDGVERDSDDMPCAFRIDARTEIPIGRLRRLYMLLQDASADQTMGRGVTLTLRARSPGRGVPIVEAIIDSRQSLAEGPFAGHAAVLVEPDLEMIRVVDNRHKTRVRATAEATLFHGDSTLNAATPCRIVDFSDETLRLRTKSMSLPSLKAGSTVEVEFTLGTSAEPYRVRAKLQRQSDQGVVVRFYQLYVPASSYWRNIDPLDVLEMKTALLDPRV